MPIKPAKKSKRLANTRKRHTSWKKEAAQKKKIKAIKKSALRYILTSVLFILCFSSLFFYISYKNLTKPFAVALSGLESGQTLFLDQKSLIAVLILAVEDFDADAVFVTNAKVVLFDKNNNTLSQYDISPELELDFPGKYSYEPVEKNLALSASLNGGDIIKAMPTTLRTFENFLAFPIDRYIITESDHMPYLENLYIEGNFLSFEPTKLTALGKNLLTDMSFDDFMYLLKLRSSLETQKGIIINSANFSVEFADAVLQSKNLDSPLARERKSIAVLNGTDVTGIATFASRVVKNMGGRVIAVENTLNSQPTTYLIADDINSDSVSYIKEFFSEVQIITKSQAKSRLTQFPENELDRADIVLIIGIDSVNLL